MSIRQAFFHFILKYVDELDKSSVAFWKQVIFYSISIAILLISLLSLIPNVILAGFNNEYFTIILNAVIILIGSLLIFNRKLSYHVKAHLICVLSYFLSIILMSIYGPVGDTRIWFLLFVFFASVFTNFRFSVISAILVLVGDTIFGVLNHYLVIGWADYFDHSLFDWLIVSFNLFVVSLMIAVTLNILLKSVNDSFRRVEKSRLATIIGLAKLAEYRDADTGAHLERMSRYSVMLAASLRDLPQYKDYITQRYMDDLSVSAILHDIGKVGIPDKILLKPGKLNDEEFDVIKKHPEYGKKVLVEISEKVEDKSFLIIAQHIAHYHHEWWDGSGYPEHKKGVEIPLSARIVAIADVYDALTSDRVYKEAFTHEEAVLILNQGRGIQFDPDLIDHFNKISDDFRRLKEQF